MLNRDNISNSAYSLYAGGWRAIDGPDLQAEYEFKSQEEYDVMIEMLRDIEWNHYQQLTGTYYDPGRPCYDQPEPGELLHDWDNGESIESLDYCRERLYRDGHRHYIVSNVGARHPLADNDNGFKRATFRVSEPMNPTEIENWRTEHGFTEDN